MKGRDELVLIGPPGCGKTTLAYRLSQRLGWPVMNVDGLAHQLWPCLGLDQVHAESLYQAGRIQEWLEYMRPFDHTVLEIALTSFEGCVFDTGAGHVLGRVGWEARKDLSHLPTSLAALLRSFRAIVRVRVAPDLPVETKACAQRLVRRLQRAQEPNPYQVAALTARYFEGQARHYQVLGQMEVHTGSRASRMVAEEVAGWHQSTRGNR